MERPSALCEPFRIEKNDKGRGPIRVSREFVTKLNIDDLAGHARKEKLEKLVCSRGKGWRPDVSDHFERYPIMNCSVGKSSQFCRLGLLISSMYPILLKNKYLETLFSVYVSKQVPYGTWYLFRNINRKYSLQILVFVF